MTRDFAYPLAYPAVPGLDSIGLNHVRDDMLASAARAEKQAAEAMTDGNLGLAQRCGGEADALRRAAAQLVAYALIPTWQTDTYPTIYPVVLPEPAGTRA
jgi:hypothetical protein